MTNQMTAMMTEDEYLEHYGKKGMKWGQRKSDPPKTTHISADAARVKKIETRLKKHGPTNLSNDDLAKLNKRNQLMSEYKKNNPGKLKVGISTTKKVVNVLKGAGAVVTLGAGLAAAAKSETGKAGALAIAKVLKGL